MRQSFSEALYNWLQSSHIRSHLQAILYNFRSTTQIRNNPLSKQMHFYLIATSLVSFVGCFSTSLLVGMASLLEYQKVVGSKDTQLQDYFTPPYNLQPLKCWYQTGVCLRHLDRPDCSCCGNGNKPVIPSVKLASGHLHVLHLLVRFKGEATKVYAVQYFNAVSHVSVKVYGTVSYWQSCVQSLK